jgi:hypothetical protein
VNYPRFLFPNLNPLLSSKLDDFKESDVTSSAKHLVPDQKDQLHLEIFEVYKKELDSKMQENDCKHTFVEILKSVVTSCNLSESFAEEIWKYNVKILACIVDLLCLEMSIDFKLIANKLLSKIESHYQGGLVRIEVSSDYYKVCLSMVENLPDKIFKKGDIKVMELPESDKNVCRVLYMSTTLEYDQGHVVEEIKEAISRGS